MLNTNSNQFVHSKLIYACAISPKSTIDNQKIILGTIGPGGQSIIQLQSAQEGYKTKAYHLHNVFSAKLLFLNQNELNERFISAGEKLQIFKSEDQKISHICDLIPLSKEYVGPTFALDIHQDQQNRLISGSLDPTIRIWDLEKRKCQYQFIAYDLSKDPEQYTLDLNIAQDFNIFAFLNNHNQIGVYDIRSKMGIHRIKGKLQYNQLIWNKKQDNILIAIDYEAGLIDFYDTRDFKNKYKRIRTDHRQIVKAEWFQERNSLITAGLDRQIILYEGDKYLEPSFGLTKNYDIDNFCCQNNLFGVVSEYTFEVFSFETQCIFYQKLFMIKKFILNCSPLNRFLFSNTLNNVSKTLFLINQRLSELNNEYEMYQENTIKGEMTEIKRRRMNELQPKIHIYKQIQASVSVIDDAKQLIQMGASSDEIQMLNEEIQTQIEYLKKYQDEALSQLIEEDEYDHIRQLNVEVRAGVGGSEGSLFAEDIIGMIQNYAGLQNWDCRVISIQKDTQIGKGCKTGILQITGDNVYQQLKCESGVHKVIRVPETESKGRLHSSTASMIVLPKVTDSFHLSDKDLKYEYMRASGPGGQHVNKTESACRITHIPSGIQVVNMEDRSQERNKQRAYQILRDKLFAIHVQEKQERMAQTRKSQVAGSDRSDKIRTYNFPQERITDHRTNLTMYGIEKMLSGELLGEFIQKYQEKIHNAKLQDLLEDLQNQNKK